MSEKEDLDRLRALRDILARSGVGGSGALEDEELCELPRLYRHACSFVARLEATGRNPGLAGEARALIGRAHAVLYAEAVPPGGGLARLARFYAVDVPRGVRAEWGLLVLSLLLMYGLAGIAWLAVGSDLDLAPSFLDGNMVATEIEQLRAVEEGEPFRGNFTFGIRESPQTAGWLMLHNIGVALLFFASALVPPIYLLLLSKNALMLGTYTAVAGHWGQAGAISSILWCHGVLEIQAIVLAGTAGLVLVRAWIRPGPHSRRHAMQVESRRSLLLLAAMFPMLVCAGLIEAFVSPHAPLPVRVGTACTTGLLLVVWLGLGGRPGFGTR